MPEDIDYQSHHLHFLDKESADISWIMIYNLFYIFGINISLGNLLKVSGV